MKFSELSLIEPILQSLREEGYETPTPIQAQSIPHILSGKDLLGCAQTGTGKTAAFAIPILQRLHESRKIGGPSIPGEKRRPIRSLIVTPTRELAIQIGESFDAYGRHTGLRNTVIFGGVNQFRQVNALEKGVDILIATPGRLLDLIGQKYIRLDAVEIFVLDEADRMLDMGFVHDVRKLLRLVPEQRQSLFFSATMAPEIMVLADTILKRPVKVEVTPVSSTAEKITQSVFYVDKPNKTNLLREILKNPEIDRVLVFSRTKHGCDKIVKELYKNSIKAEAIHGNKSQNARQRALSNFKDGTIRVLVATDIAARGIDIDELSYVINYDIPEVAETYVHRIGRTGRAGASGRSFSFCDASEKPDFRAVEKLIGKKIDEVGGHPFPLEDHNAKAEPRGGGRTGRVGVSGRPPRGESRPGRDKDQSAGSVYSGIRSPRHTVQNDRPTEHNTTGRGAHATPGAFGNRPNNRPSRPPRKEFGGR